MVSRYSTQSKRGKWTGLQSLTIHVFTIRRLSHQRFGQQCWCSTVWMQTRQDMSAPIWTPIYNRSTINAQKKYIYIYIYIRRLTLYLLKTLNLLQLSKPVVFCFNVLIVAVGIILIYIYYYIDISIGYNYCLRILLTQSERKSR